MSQQMSTSLSVDDLSLSLYKKTTLLPSVSPACTGFFAAVFLQNALLQSPQKSYTAYCSIRKSSTVSPPVSAITVSIELSKKCQVNRFSQMDNMPTLVLMMCTSLLPTHRNCSRIRCLRNHWIDTVYQCPRQLGKQLQASCCVLECWSLDSVSGLYIRRVDGVIIQAHGL